MYVYIYIYTYIYIHIHMHICIYVYPVRAMHANIAAAASILCVVLAGAASALPP